MTEDRFITAHFRPITHTLRVWGYNGHLRINGVSHSLPWSGEFYHGEVLYLEAEAHGVRGTGIGLDLSLQTAQVSKSVLSNTPSKFIGRVASYSDLDVIGSAMGLTQEQRLWMSHHLERGMWVGQLGLGDRRPFVFRTPKVNFDASSPETVDDLFMETSELPRLTDLRE